MDLAIEASSQDYTNLQPLYPNEDSTVSSYATIKVDHDVTELSAAVAEVAQTAQSVELLDSDGYLPLIDSCTGDEVKSQPTACTSSFDSHGYLLPLNTNAAPSLSTSHNRDHDRLDSDGYVVPLSEKAKSTACRDPCDTSCLRCDGSPQLHSGSVANDDQNNTNAGNTAGDSTVASSVVYNSNSDTGDSTVASSVVYNSNPDGYEEISDSGYNEILDSDNETANRHSDRQNADEYSEIADDNERYLAADANNEITANDIRIDEELTGDMEQQNSDKATRHSKVRRYCGLAYL